MSPELVPTAGGPDVLPNPVPAPDPEPPKPDPTPEPSPVPPLPEPAPAFFGADNRGSDVRNRLPRTAIPTLRKSAHCSCW
jgi:hypothetical protein